jgi:predicted acylesterase/phospholipase RssA
VLPAEKVFADRRKAAFKALGGRAKAVYWHLGVSKALETVGFRFVGGVRVGDEPREYGGTVFNPVIGSSAGALFTAFVARGYTIDELFSVRIRPEYVFQRNPIHPLRYLRRVGRVVQYRTGKPFRLRDLRLGDLLAWRALYTPQGLERYVREELLKGVNRFEQLRAELYIIATELDDPRVVVFGEKDSGQIYDYKYVSGASISEAAAASMAFPPIYAPCSVAVGRERKYYMDGELRDPFSTHVAEDSGADLVVVSSVYQPFQFSKELGSLFRFGLAGVYPQARDQSLHAKQQNAVLQRRKMAAAVDFVYEYTRRYLPQEVCERLAEELEHRLDCRRRNFIIYINPERDLEVYRVHPFDFSEEARKLVIRHGFARAMEVMCQHGVIEQPIPFEEVVRWW